jgi:serine/threonine-protein kinase
MTDTNATITPGTVLAGKYRVDCKLGEGGMGAVWKAVQTDLDRPVAIKVLLDEFKDDVQFVERFFREAKAAARVKGAHVVTIIDVGKLESGVPYIAMELLDGEDLSKVVEREGKLDVTRAATYMLHACAAVAEAHAARVVHRDLKPANLFLAKLPNGKTVLKVLDFGISRVEDSASKLTHTQSALGTAFYMSPEQIMSPKTVDLRVDIWALGVIFYELLCGKTPFDGENLPQVIAHVLQNTRIPLRDVDPSIPGIVDAIVDRCLQMSPENRYQTAVEMAGALAPLTGGGEGAAVVEHLRSLPPPTFDLGAASQSKIVVPSAPRLPAALDIPTEVAPPNVHGAPTVVAPPAVVAPPVGVDAPPTVVDPPNAIPALVPDLDLKPKAPPPAASQGAPPPSRALSGEKPQVVLGSNGGGVDSSMLELDRKPAVQRRDPLRVQELAARERAREGKRRARGGGISFRWLRFPIAALLVVAIPVVWFIVVPNMVNKRIDEAAARAGLTVTHDPVSLSTSGVTIGGVVAHVASLPGTSVKATSIDVTWAADQIAVHGAFVSSHDAPDAILRAARTANGAIPAKIDVADITAEYAVRDDVSLTGTTGRLTVTGAGAARTSTLSFGEVRLVTKSGAFGPYRVDAEDGAEATRVRVGLDPASPAGANMMAVWSAGAVRFTAKVPKAALAGYGVPAQLVGLREGDEPEVELDVDAQSDAQHALTGKATFGLYRAKLGPSPVDVTSELMLTGNADGFDAKSTRARLGPFPATINAQWRAADKERFLVTFQSTPVPCSDLAMAKAKSSPFGQIVADVAAYTGIVSVGGRAQVRGNVVVALEAPPKVSAKIAESDTCGLLIFPRKL